MKNLLGALLAFVMLAVGVLGITNIVQASATTAPIELVVSAGADLSIKAGETVHVKVPIRTVSGYLAVTSIEVTPAAGAPFSISDVALTKSDTKISGVTTDSGTFLEFDVKTKDTASIGEYSVTAKFSFVDNDPETTTVVTNLTFDLEVLSEKSPSQLTINDVILSEKMIGSDSQISFTVKNEGELEAKNVYLVMDFQNVMLEGYTVKNIKIGDLASGETERVTLPVSILATAVVGRNTIVGNFTYKTIYGGDALTSKYNIRVNLEADQNRPILAVDSVKPNTTLKPGKDFILTLKLENYGENMAEDVKVDVDDASISKDGILRNYYTDDISGFDIESDKKKTVEIPLSISKYATGGLRDVKLNVTYMDDAGLTYTLTYTVYLDIIAEVAGTTPNLVISKVKQSPAQPQAGSRVEVSFDVENKSLVDVKDLKISVAGLTSSNFIPVLSEPYQYIEKLGSGEKVRISIPLTVSETIAEGLNSIDIKCAYTGGDTSVNIPISNVVNELGVIGKPKLIVSKYSSDLEELRAGSTFNFTFDILNTNNTVAAKNITITITQADNVFSVTQGSNSFFVAKISAGETVSTTVEMKVKSDATTKAYPIEITIEYEYDGIEANPTTGEVGESIVQKLNLQAIENSRPVVDNVSVYSWDGAVMTGTAATLSFEFYNMGKSPLNNVIATVEGDFTKTDGEMYFIGNAAEGSSSYIEFEVMPGMEGTAKGTVRITFEDSNGDEVEFTKDFEAEVMP
ncbi:MAG: hypothetical protein WBI07_09320, partial [Mobilitalea sp.]